MDEPRPSSSDTRDAWAELLHGNGSYNYNSIPQKKTTKRKEDTTIMVD